MIVHCAHDELVEIKKLKLHPKNRNKHPDAQIKRLAEILKYQGFRNPIKVSNRSGFVTAGHGRIMAALINNWPTVPVNFQDYESEEQEIADLNADNAIALWAELDLEGIRLDIGEMPDLKIDMLGLENFDILPTLKTAEGAKELNESDFSDFDHKCPKCGFEFDG